MRGEFKTVLLRPNQKNIFKILPPASEIKKLAYAIAGAPNTSA
jgi:hypothetical protein